MKITRDVVRQLRDYMDCLWNGSGHPLPRDWWESRTYEIIHAGAPISYRAEKRRALVEMLRLQGILS